MTTTITGSGGVSQVQDGSIGTADFAANAITAAKLPAGSVLQVVNSDTTTQVAATSNSYVDTGLTAAITPSSTSSKILVVVHQNGFRKEGADTYINMRLYRAATSIQQLAVTTGYTASTATLELGTISASYLDSPNTTSATTYKTKYGNNTGNGTVYLQANNVVSTITLIEIKG